jgi:hypothetical protein
MQPFTKPRSTAATALCLRSWVSAKDRITQLKCSTTMYVVGIDNLHGSQEFLTVRPLALSPAQHQGLK